MIAFRQIFLCPDRNTRRSDGIDILRCLFALWVLLGHLFPFIVIAQGEGSVPEAATSVARFVSHLFQPNREINPAVLAFIVLSGYCIHRNGFRDQPVSTWPYFLRRAFRVLPVYVLATILGLILYQVAFGYDERITRSLSGTSAISTDCVAAKLSAFAAFLPAYYPCSYAGNGPLQTVMVEIVLYAIYPICLALLLSQRGASVFLVLLISSWVVGVLVSFAAPSTAFYIWWQNSSLLGFLPYWWLGAAFVSSAFEGGVKKYGWVLVLLWLALTGFVSEPFGPAVSEARKLVFALLIGLLVCAVDRRSFSFSAAPVLIGRSGYSLYAFHAPIVYCMAVMGYQWWLILTVTVAFGVAMAWLIELPLSRYGARLARRRSDRLAVT